MSELIVSVEHLDRDKLKSFLIDNDSALKPYETICIVNIISELDNMGYCKVESILKACDDLEETYQRKLRQADQGDDDFSKIKKIIDFLNLQLIFQRLNDVLSENDVVIHNEFKQEMKL